jgi:hypothetical protein
MILDDLLAAGRIRSPWTRVILGAGVAALAVSGATAGVLWLLGMGMNAGVSGALGAAAAAAYAVKVHRSTPS